MIILNEETADEIIELVLKCVYADILEDGSPVVILCVFVEKLNSLVVNKNNCTLVPTDKLKEMQNKLDALEE